MRNSGTREIRNFRSQATVGKYGIPLTSSRKKEGTVLWSKQKRTGKLFGGAHGNVDVSIHIIV